MSSETIESQKLKINSESSSTTLLDMNRESFDS